jgi:hypothetical protein
MFRRFRRTQAARRAGPSLAGLVVALALAAVVTQPARAQDVTLPGGVQFFVTPYLWLAGISAAIKIPLPRAPEVNADVSAIDLLSI